MGYNVHDLGYWLGYYSGFWNFQNDNKNMSFYQRFNAQNRLNIKKGILVSVITLLLFLVVPITNAVDWQPLIIDNFETYISTDPDNALEGQGNWVYVSGDHNVVVVQTENVLNGQKAIGQLSPCNQIERVSWSTSTKILDGSQWFSIKTDHVASGDKDAFYLYFKQDGEWNFGLQIHYDGTFRAYGGAGDWYGLIPVVADKWYDIHFEWRSIDDKFRVSIYDSVLETELHVSAWFNMRQNYSTGINNIQIEIDGRIPVMTYLVLDHFSDIPSWEDIYVPPLPSVYFDSPANYSEVSESPLLITGNFENWDTEIYDAIRLVGCSDETMRCIVPQDFIPTGSTGNFDFTIPTDLTVGLYDFYFNIVVGSWICNPANSPELHLYILTDFATTSPPYLPPPPETELKDPYVFYFENTEYETTTALFNSLTNSFGAGFIWIYNLLDIFDYFQINANVGQNIGQAMATGRAYLGNINAFFGDLPMIQMFLLYLGVLLIVGILRFIKYIRNLLPFV